MIERGAARTGELFVSSKTRRNEHSSVRLAKVRGNREFDLVKVYPSKRYQRVIGFGAALTEASGYVYANLEDAQKRRFVQECFGPEGNRYSFCRIVVQSSDFGLGPRSYVSSARDKELATFSLEGDRLYELPLIHDAIGANAQLRFIASPWSPPSWAKTNRTMVAGGKLRKRYYPQWARIVARYVHDYRCEGVSVTHVTVQNEPKARQTWESCLFDAASEFEFATEHLVPALEQVGCGDARVLVWDQNKDQVVERAGAMLGPDGRLDRRLGGVAFHWYTGDHFDALASVREAVGPDADLVFTEGCEAYSGLDASVELQHAEHYAHEIVGDLKAGANGIVDWNVLLDSHGGPNHVANYCDAPIMTEGGDGNLRFRLPHVYLGHFSRHVRPGAVRVLASSYTTDLETVAFSNPDGSMALVVLNRTGWKRSFECMVVDEGKAPLACRLDSEPHSILTFVWR